jgi:type II secretory pathway pseudopilin PulG
MIIVGLGLGLTMPVYTLVVQNAVERRMIGAATAATQFFRQIGGTVGTAIFTSAMLGRFSAHFDANAPQGVSADVLAPFKNPLQLVQILPQLQQQFASLPNGPQLLQALLLDVKDSLVYAIQGSFLLGAVLMAAACVVNFFLKEVPLKKSYAPEGQGATQATTPTEPGTPVAVGALSASDDSSSRAML